MNKSFFSILFTVLLVVSVGGRIVSRAMKNQGGPAKAQSVEQELKQIAQLLNTQTPMIVDEETRLDRVIAGPGRKLQFVHTLVNARLGELDDIAIEEFQSIARPDLLQRVKSEARFQELTRKGVVCAWKFQDKLGALITTIEVTPEDVKAAR